MTSNDRAVYAHSINEMMRYVAATLIAARNSLNTRGLCERALDNARTARYLRQSNGSAFPF